ncbi:Conserved_hypothetical protein [Hexamita inflata]|uniref:Uncharacterized protein n=1 Tax=Hexamita inflata TaxID=28002 RepID=A0AA86NVM6_9EUKA|nr:Conserved hypothetical protein [Hexamita inflata]
MTSLHDLFNMFVEIKDPIEMQKLQAGIQSYSEDPNYLQMLFNTLNGDQLRSEDSKRVVMVQIKNCIKNSNIKEFQIKNQIFESLLSLLPYDSIAFQRINSEAIGYLIRIIHIETVIPLVCEIIKGDWFQKLPKYSQTILLYQAAKLRNSSIITVDMWAEAIESYIPFLLSCEFIEQVQTLKYSFTPRLHLLYFSYIPTILDTYVNRFSEFKPQMQVEILLCLYEIVKTASKIQSASLMVQNQYADAIQQLSSTFAPLVQFSLNLLQTTTNEFVLGSLFLLLKILLVHTEVDQNTLQLVYQYLVEVLQQYIRTNLLRSELEINAENNFDTQQLQEVLANVFELKIDKEKNYVEAWANLVSEIKKQQHTDPNQDVLTIWQEILQQFSDNKINGISYYINMIIISSTIYNKTHEMNVNQFITEYFSYLVNLLPNIQSLPPMIIWHSLQCGDHLACFNLTDHYEQIVQLCANIIYLLKYSRTKTEMLGMLQFLINKLATIKALSEQHSVELLDPIVQCFPAIFEFVIQMPICFPLYSQIFEVLTAVANIVSVVDAEIASNTFCENLNNFQINQRNYEQLIYLLELFCTVYSVGGAITQDGFEVIGNITASLLNNVVKNYRPENYRQFRIILDSVQSLFSNQYVANFNYAQVASQMFQSYIQFVLTHGDSYANDVLLPMLTLADYCKVMGQTDVYQLCCEGLKISDFDNLKVNFVLCLSCGVAPDFDLSLLPKVQIDYCDCSVYEYLAAITMILINLLLQGRDVNGPHFDVLIKIVPALAGYLMGQYASMFKFALGQAFAHYSMNNDPRMNCFGNALDLIQARASGDMNVVYDILNEQKIEECKALDGVFLQFNNAYYVLHQKEQENEPYSFNPKLLSQSE